AYARVTSGVTDWRYLPPMSVGRTEEDRMHKNLELGKALAGLNEALNRAYAATIEINTANHEVGLACEEMDMAHAKQVLSTVLIKAKKAYLEIMKEQKQLASALGFPSNIE